MSAMLGPSVGYVDLLDHVTKELLEKEEAEARKYHPLRPSAAGKCTRELYYDAREYYGLEKYPKTLKTPETHRLLNFGNPVEFHLLKQFELAKEYFTLRYKQQVLSFTQLKAKNPKYAHLLEGSLDAVFWSPKWKCVMDVKSKKDGYDFRAKKTRWESMSEKLAGMSSVEVISDQSFWVENLDAFLEELNDPFFESNFLQLNLYALSDFLVQRGVDHAAIIQYSKNDSKLREVRFKPSQTLFDKVIAKFQTVTNAIDQDKEALATRDYPEGSFKCRYCAYVKTCWGKASTPKRKRLK